MPCIKLLKLHNYKHFTGYENFEINLKYKIYLNYGI